ncbi:MAG: signal recognition particle-docking protein FtsY [Planctomycetota bacterium]
MGLFKGVFKKLSGALGKTRDAAGRTVTTLLTGQTLSAELLRQVEKALIQADVGVKTAIELRKDLEAGWERGEIETGDEALDFLKQQLVAYFPAEDRSLHFAESGPTVVLVAGINGAGKTTSIAQITKSLRDAWKRKEVTEGDQVIPFFKARLASKLAQGAQEIRRAESGPTVILVCGVNGAGKTTSIAKLTGWFVDRGDKVVLAAGDTFRAAAVEQLTIWSKRLGVEIVKQATGADPAAVAYDAAEAAVSRKADVLIVDTAGRLHTQKNLMEELSKIRRVLQKRIPEAPHETLLVVDGTTGQNAVQQARLFSEVSPVSGIFITKLDGTARGGAVLSIRDEMDIPIKFVGLGEQREDIEAFDATTFVDALFA